MIGLLINMIEKLADVYESRKPWHMQRQKYVFNVAHLPGLRKSVIKETI